MMKCSFRYGKVYSRTLELQITHHCNLSCRSCSHLSPVTAKYSMTPDQIYHDLHILSKYYQSQHVRILGGEPLLHPQLIEVLQAASASGVSDHIRIITNGLLLPKMPDIFWQSVDEIHVSVYPGNDLTEEQRKYCELMAESCNVSLRYLYYDRFRESYSEIGTTDINLVKRIYNSCKMAHDWCCFTVHDGFFYKCPQSVFLPLLIDKPGFPRSTTDGLRIVDDPTYRDQLIEYLETDKPLASCSHCLGSVGKIFVHEQINRKRWRQCQMLPTEDLLDVEHLEWSEADVSAKSLCLRSHTE